MVEPYTGINLSAWVLRSGLQTKEEAPHRAGVAELFVATCLNTVRKRKLQIAKVTRHLCSIAAAALGSSEEL